MRCLPLFAILAALVFAGCPSRNSDPGPDAVDAEGRHDAGGAGGGGGGPAGAAGQTGVVTSTPWVADSKPLAAGCASNAECASGFCVDSVCCDSACDGQCAECNIPGEVGYCTPQIVGDDTTSADPCTGAHTCSLAFSFFTLPACRLKDLQACSANADCASLNCVTFYVDGDGDGYGQAGKTLQLCEEQGAVPPAGYAAKAGDCCDTDASAHPGQAKYFGVIDACGSWDYDCNGSVVTQAGVPPASGCSETIQEGDTSYLEPTNCH